MKSVVACYSLDGKLLRTYKTAKAASRNRKVYIRTIDKCIRGDISTVKNLQWKRFPIDNVPSWIPPLEINKETLSIRPVAKLNSNGEIIETYPSIKKAAISNNMDPHSLRDRLEKKYKFEGQEKYRLLTIEEIEKYGYQKGNKIVIETKPIIQYTLSGEYVKTYPSINKALIELGKSTRNQTIKKCLSGTYKTAFGYKWKYKTKL